MPDHTLKGLIALIASAESVEIRRAAVRVATALKPGKEHALNQALLGVLDETDSDLRRLAIEALGEVRAEEALPRLVELVAAGGAEVEPAVRAIGHLGSRGTKALGQVMSQATTMLRRRIAAMLALAGTESAVLATAESLLDDDPGVVEASAKSLALEVPQLTAAQKRTLVDHLLALLAPANRQPKPKASKSRQPPEKTAKLAPVSEAAMLRVLAALHAPEAEEIYFARLDLHQHAALRAAALQALAALPLSINDAKLRKLLSCAAAADFAVVAPALMLLKKVPASRQNIKRWLELFDAPDVAAHMLAVEKLREVDTSEVAQALLKQLNHADKGLRESAIAALHHLKAGREVMFAALLDSGTPEEAWKLARSQADMAGNWSAAQRAKVFALACKGYEKVDRRADALWFVLREANREWLGTQLEERATALRKKKNFAGSLSYWRLLTRDPAVGSQLRFELAATLLKVSNHDATAAVRDADPALEEFSRLLQDSTFDLFGRVRATKWLDESDLFYLGFHFAEQSRLAREFGGQVLTLVMERWPKSTWWKNAKQKLKSEGLN